MKKKKRIFASAPSEQAQQTKKEVLSGKCLRTQHNKADRQTKLFKAADGIIAALKKRSALPVHANNSRAAFTLAEVLITLAIIGVVSALTIPTLVQKTNKQEYVSALQKAYSTLSQAAQTIIAENGSPKCNDGGWACSMDNVYNIYKKYLNNAKECGSEAGCMPGAKYKDFGGGELNWTDAGSTRDLRLILADGILVWFTPLSGGNDVVSCNYSWGGDTDICFAAGVDVNGAKKPNTIGRDYFLFFVNKDGRLFPAGCSVISSDCRKETNGGYSCTCKVLREGKMDY